MSEIEQPKLSDTSEYSKEDKQSATDSSSPSPTKAPTLLLIDGYGFLFRAYHSLPPLTSPDGRPVGAVYGFINMLLKLRASHICDYMAVIFDAGKKTFRHELYVDYKANRPVPPDDLIPQFPLVREAVEAFNIPSIDKEGFEADDLIATYSQMAKKEGMEVVIVSSDKDLTQLVDDKVRLYDPLKSRYIDREAVKEKFGVYPDKIGDMLALMGDSSDNIPGVPGIGPKTAALLLEEYGDLVNLLERAHEIKQDKRRQALIENKDKALLSRRLVALDEKVIVDRAISSFGICLPDESHLVTFLTKQGFKTVLNKLSKEGVIQQSVLNIASCGIANSSHSDFKHSGAETVCVQLETQTDLQEFVARLGEIDQFACYPLWNPAHEVLAGFGFATDTGLVANLLLQPDRAQQQTDLFEQKQITSEQGISLLEVIDTLRPIFENKSILCISADFKSLWRYLAERGIKVDMHPYEDVMLMSYVLHAGLHDHILPSMITQHLQLSSEASQQFNTKKASSSEIRDHLGCCTPLLLQLYRVLKQALFKEHMVTLYEQIEKPLISVLLDMEIQGIKVDLSLLKKLSVLFAEELAKLEKIIHQLAGKEFNIGSPKQLAELLFVEMQLGSGKKSKKSGVFSTDAENLERLAADGHEIAEHILQWRSFSKLKSTYTDALAKQIQEDGRVHTHYAMMSVNTGRLSSYDPNLQNIPVRTELGNQIREVFIAEKNYKLISADYSQIELRLLAHVADIDILKKAFLEDKDIHAATASQIFEVPLEQVTSDLRRSAKMINFGIIYGMSAFGLARRLGISREEASLYIEKYFRQYPGIRQYMEETIAFARQHGYVQTIFGRKCYIRGILDKNGGVRQFSERAAINAPLQGAAADIIKKAMVQLHPILTSRFEKTKLLLQVHDELVLETPEQQANEVMEIVKQVMEQVVDLSIPLTVGAKVGDNWNQIH